MRILLDACSFIHFLAAGEENILIQQAKKWDAQLMTCAAVAEEIERVTLKPKYATSGAEGRWRALSERVTRLSDAPEETPGLGEALSDLDAADFTSSIPLAARLAASQNLGEFIAVAHCLALARAGHDVILIIDDDYGRRLVNMAQQILLREDIPYKRLRKSGTRQIVQASEAAWRRHQASVDETLHVMEKYGAIPDWS